MFTDHDAILLFPEDVSYKTLSVELPNKCPECSIAYGEDPVIIYYITSHEGGNSNYVGDAYAIYYCPHCEKCFYVTYIVTGRYSQTPEAHILIPYPAPTCQTSFSKAIKDISQKFIDIYQQSEKAEAHGLIDVCGLGYRKALEFLIKDFAILLHPESEDQICGKPLSQCISDYIPNEKIKALAKASVWLGNDEAHYIRKHENYNLQNLKAFINAIVMFIDSEIAFYEASELISTPSE